MLSDHLRRQWRNYEHQGDYRVVWTLFVDNNSADDLNIVDLDVNDATTSTVLTTLTVTREMFQQPFEPQNFTAYFKLPAGSALPQLEFRVYYHCCVYLVHVVRADVAPLCSLWDVDGFGLLADDHGARPVEWRFLRVLLERRSPLEVYFCTPVSNQPPAANTVISRLTVCLCR
jgi:hypothetical protein